MNAITIRNSCPFGIRLGSFTIPCGALTVISGPSGSGKSALLREVLAGGAAVNRLGLRILEDSLPLPPFDIQLPADEVRGVPETRYLGETPLPTLNRILAERWNAATVLVELMRAMGQMRCRTCGGGVARTPVTSWAENIVSQNIHAEIALALVPEPHESANQITAATTLGFTRVLSFESLSGEEASRISAPILDQFSCTPETLPRIQDAVNLIQSLGGAGLAIARGPTLNEVQVLAASGFCRVCNRVTPEISTPSGVSVHAWANAPENAAWSLDGQRCPDLLTLPLPQLVEILARAPQQIRGLHELLQICRAVCAVGDGTVSLLTELTTLSFEAWKLLHLGELISHPPTHSALLIDDFSRGLSENRLNPLLDRLKGLRALGTTLILVDNHPTVCGSADTLISLPVSFRSQSTAAPKLGWLSSGARSEPPPPQEVGLPAGEGSARFADLTLAGDLSMKEIPVRVLLGGINLVRAQSAERTLQALYDLLPNSSLKFLGVTEVESVHRITLLDHALAAVSTVGTLLELLPRLRELFAQLPFALKEGFRPQSFDPASKQSIRDGTTCAACHGQGVGQYALPPELARLAGWCPVCNGSGLGARAEKVRFHGLSFQELLALPLAESSKVLQAIPRCASKLCTTVLLGLGHLALRDRGRCLSTAERELVLLSRGLSRALDPSSSKQIIIIDELGSTMSTVQWQNTLEALEEITNGRATLFIGSSGRKDAARFNEIVLP